MNAKGIRIILFAIALLAFSPIVTKAQRVYEPKFYIGAKGGASLSRVSFSPSVKQSFEPGILMGITARYTEEKVFGLMAELYFVQRGWKENYSEEEQPPSPLNYERKINYITLPVMTHIYFGSDKVHGFFNIGPSVSLMFSESTTSNFNYENPSSVPDFPSTYRPEEQLVMPVKNKFDYGLVGGVGAEFFFGRNSIMIEGRYYFGLGSIYPGSKKDVFSASRPMSIEVSLAYLFRVK